MPNLFLYNYTILFQTIHFSISTLFSSIWPIHRTLSGATTLGQSGPGSDGNKGVLRIPQSSSITGASLSDCLVSYQDTHWGRNAVSSVFCSPSCLGRLKICVTGWMKFSKSKHMVKYSSVYSFSLPYFFFFFPRLLTKKNTWLYSWLTINCSINFFLSLKNSLHNLELTYKQG